VNETNAYYALVITANIIVFNILAELIDVYGTDEQLKEIPCRLSAVLVTLRTELI
jgi:hypothetical protein